MSESDMATPVERVVRAIVERQTPDAWEPLVAAGVAGPAADALLTHLRGEVERYLGANLGTALVLADALIHGARLAALPDHEARGLLLKADVLRFFGRFPESIDLYEAARALFATLGDEVGWARTFSGWVWSANFVGRGEQALAAVEPAHAILVRHAEWMRAANLDLHTAVVCTWLGRYERALALYERAQATYEGLDGDLADLRAAMAKANRAEVLTLLGDFQAALALHTEARAVFVAHAATETVLRQDQYIADTHASLGDYTEALRRYGLALAALDAADLNLDAGWVALSMATCYLSLNQDAAALTYADEAVRRFERSATPTEAAKARLAGALARARRGEREEAHALLTAADATFARTGLVSQRALVALQRASLALDEGDWPAARACAGEASASFAALGLVIRRAEADLILAGAALEEGERAATAALAEAALAVARERQVGWLLHQGHHLLARVAEASGRGDAALAAYEAAVDAVDRAQSRLALSLRTRYLADKLALYDDAIDCCLRLGRPTDAFVFLERAKARALVDYLTARPGVRPRALDAAHQALADELSRLRQEHHWFYNRLYGYGLGRRTEEGQADTPSPGEVAALEGQLADREARINRLVERLSLYQADALEDLGLTPPREQFAPPRLDAETLVLEYRVGRHDVGLFTVDRGVVAWHPLSLAPAALHRLLDAWRLNVEASAGALAAGRPLAGLLGNARAILGALFRALLAPVAGWLAGRRHLIVVPHGPLHGLPFHALHDGQNYLIERTEVSVCPSGRWLQWRAARPPHPRPGALVVADSQGGLLPRARAEALAVAALLEGTCLLDGDATRGAFIQAAAGHGVVHIAAHGEARLDEPDFGHVQLADGQVTMTDILNLRLDDALVTLSACETGQGVITAGDEAIGLSRGVLVAGAATLVQSLWRVDDDSTAILMESFYRALCAGQPSGAALRQAQRALLAGTNPHPFIWAPFQLMGDGRTRLDRPTSGAPGAATTTPSPGRAA